MSKEIKIKVTEAAIEEAVAVARNEASAEGRVKVVCANKTSARARLVHYGFNFQPKGEHKVGDVFVDRWAGSTDHAFGNVCKVVDIV